jgi:uncharacterized protein YrrD
LNLENQEAIPMLKLELREGADVVTPGAEQVGTVNGFVLDPATNEVTHLVVKKGGLLSQDKILPFELVETATQDKVVLSEDIENFDELPPFEETHYIRAREADISRGGNPRYLADEPGGDSPLEQGELSDPTGVDVSRGESARFSYNPAYYWYPPHGYVGYPVGFYGWPPMATVRNIPEDTIPLREGTDVISSEGEHVGDVERLFVEPSSNKATHFVISQGVFFKDRKLVPAHWVRSVGEDKVHLSVRAELLEELPSYDV